MVRARSPLVSPTLVTYRAYAMGLTAKPDSTGAFSASSAPSVCSGSAAYWMVRPSCSGSMGRAGGQRRLQWTMATAMPT